MEYTTLGTFTVVLDSPEMHRLSATESRRIAGDFVARLQATLEDLGYKDFQLRLDSAHSGCIKAKISLLVATAALLVSGASFIDKYPELRMTLPHIVVDAGNAFHCKIQHHQAVCKVWLQKSSTTEHLHQVVKGDTLQHIVGTLWEVPQARQRQVMLGTVASNPHAFVNGDMNKLILGSVLVMPTEQMLKGIPGGPG